MKTYIISSIIGLLLLVQLGCEKKVTETRWPNPIALGDAFQEMDKGFISKVDLELREGKTVHQAILYLSESGKKSKYQEIGYQGQNEIAYYKLEVKNPFTFEDSVRKREVPLSRLIIE